MKYIRKNDRLIFTIDQFFHHKTLDDFFHYYHFSKKTIHLLRQNKDYTLNHHYVAQAILKKGDLLSIKAYHRDDGMYAPVYHELDVRYEDDILLIVNKPAYLPVYPSSQENTHSLSHYVAGYYKRQGEDLPVRFIHRLDDNTSGLVIYCKSYLMQAYLDYLLSIKAIHRYYYAFVEGLFKSKKEQTIHNYLARDRHDSRKMRVANHGHEAITHFKLIKNYSHYALIQCQLETGRKHQIRVHLASINHPLIGDPLYNPHLSQIKRQALHAYLIDFIHPITQESLRITSCLPDDLLFLDKG